MSPRQLVATARHVRASIPIAAEESPPGDSSLPARQPPAAERRALEPPSGAGGPAFARGLWRIAAADVSSGNDVQLLHDGPATFDAMCEAIDAARETIVLEAYIFRSDEMGHRIADALIRAVARGVKVRLLTDWIGIRGTSRG